MFARRERSPNIISESHLDKIAQPLNIQILETHKYSNLHNKIISIWKRNWHSTLNRFTVFDLSSLSVGKQSGNPLGCCERSGARKELQVTITLAGERGERRLAFLVAQ